MKNGPLVALLVFCFLSAQAQKNAQLFEKKELNDPALSSKEYRLALAKYDLSKVFTVTNNAFVYGFIGNNYQRIRIKFISVSKNPRNANIYHVSGRSMVKNNRTDLSGDIKVFYIRSYKQPGYGVDNQYKNKLLKGRYIAIGRYRVAEPATKPHSGVFRGSFVTYFYIDRYGAVHYDDIDRDADGYINNQFVGQWVSHNWLMVETCNWGDYRIPEQNGLDIGAGEFSPADRYLSSGWQSLRDTWSQNKSIADQAKKIESAHWWK